VKALGREARCVCRQGGNQSKPPVSECVSR
jgi:hypothetical protein